MVSNSSRDATGPVSRSEALASNWYNVPLVPFYALLLIGSQVTDVIGFLGRHLNSFFDIVYYEILVLIDKLPLNLRVKYYLMVAAGWLATTILVVALLISMVMVSKIRRQVPISETTATSDSPTPLLTDVSMKIDDNTRWPGMVAPATGSGVIRLTDEEIVEFLTKVDSLTPWQQAELSQGEKLDLALLYYHVGQRAAYDQWIQQAWLMDPNSEYFIRP